MKIAITAKGANLDSEVDPRFGRAAYILIVDSETHDFEAMDNKENLNAFKGAGIQAACMVSEKNVEVLLTGFCGPNAFRTLQAVKVGVASGASGSVREVLQAFLDGKLPLSDKENTEGQW